MPARATLSPSSVQSAISVAGASVSVPGKRMCSGLRPTFCGGKNNTGSSGGNSGSAASITPWSSVASTDTGRCGPCCSVAATGNTATVRSMPGDAASCAKSRVPRSAQKRDGSAGWESGSVGICPW